MFSSRTCNAHFRAFIEKCLLPGFLVSLPKFLFRFNCAFVYSNFFCCYFRLGGGSVTVEQFFISFFDIYFFWCYLFGFAPVFHLTYATDGGVQQQSKRIPMNDLKANTINNTHTTPESPRQHANCIQTQNDTYYTHTYVHMHVTLVNEFV